MNMNSRNVTYSKVGDYLLPNLTLPQQEKALGKYGRLRRTYLMKHRPVLYNSMLLSGTLHGERRPMNAICDTTAKSETLSVKGCKVKITYAPADMDCLDAIQKLLQTTILRTAGHTAA